VTKKDREQSTDKEPQSAPRFEDALKRLEEIVTRLELGELALEESLALYEEGIALSRNCHAKLEEAEGRIEMLLKDAKGEARLDAAGKAKTKAIPAKDDDVPF
jgi:exodeoxyribonuclease VII small subunit